MADKLGVIFDMDGVLVDSYVAHLRSWRSTGERYGYTMTDDQFQRTFGRTSRDIISNVWPGKFDDDAAREFDAKKEAAYRDLLRERFPEMDGAGDLIGALHAAGFLLAIGSSGPPENVAVIREQITNGGLFTATVDGTQVKHGKPDPEVFLIAARKLGLEPQSCAVVEDAPAGVEAARRAGMAAIALTGTATREVLLRRAHLVVDSLRELTPDRITRNIALASAGSGID